ncbi:MAG: hypothetical protein ACK501_06115 [Planctomycetota bacterium]|jgi:hypothetical protein
MKKARETLWLSLVALVLLLSLWWWQRGDYAVPLPVETPPVANDAAPTAAVPANTGAPEPERSAAVDATAPTPKAAATATFDLLVVDAATQQPVADAEAFWSDATTRERVKQLPKEQARELWDSQELMAQQFGRRARSDRDGRLRVVADKQGCQVFARAGDRYGEISIYANNPPPEGGHRLLLARDEQLRVRVLDAAGQPAERVRVGLSFGTEASSGANSSLDTYASTDAEGVATLAHLQQLRMNRRGLDASHATTGCVVGIAIPGLPATPVVVAPSEPLPTEPIELHLPPTASLRVRCTVAGLPMHGLDRVRVHEGAERSSRTANLGADERVDDDGWAWFRWLPAELPLFATPVGPNVPFAQPTALPPLVVGELVEHHIDFASGAVVLRGRLLDSAGAPMANTSLLLQYDFGEGGGLGNLRTDPEGRFLHVSPLPAKTESQPLVRFELMPLDRQELRLAVTPRDLHAGLNELGDLHFGGEPLVCAGRLDGYEARTHGAWMVLQRQDTDPRTGAMEWRSLGQPEVGIGQGGVFAARGRLAPGRYRLSIVAREYLPVPPLEFALGQQDLVVPMRRAEALEVVCLLPQNIDADQLVLDLVGGPARTWIPEDHGAYGRPADNRRGYAMRAKNDAATFQWSAVEPGTYTLRAAVLGGSEAALEVANVIVPASSGGDPRLAPLDLRGSLRLVALQVLDPRGDEVGNGAHLFLEPQANPRHWSGALLLGRSARALLPVHSQSVLVVRDGCRPTKAVVPADVAEFAVRIEPWPRVELALADPTLLPEGCELRLYASPAASRQTGSFSVRGHSGELESWFRPDASMIVLQRGAPVGKVVVGDGPCTLSLYLQRGEHQRGLRRFTPNVVVAGAPVTITLDAAEVAAVAAALNEPQKAK